MMSSSSFDERSPPMLVGNAIDVLALNLDKQQRSCPLVHAAR
jgi:hypothetical protein